MNVQTTSSEILGEVYWHVGAEVLETLALREADDSDIIKLGNAVKATRGARASLLPLLKEAAKLGDIYLLLEVERIFLEQERKHLSEAPIKTSSLDNAIEEINAAEAMLDDVRDPGYYQKFDKGFSLEKNRRQGYPNDQARQFFDSHKTRLSNIERGRLEKGERELLNVRADNMQTARKLYIELQRQALAAADIREPRAVYAPFRLRLAS